VGFLKRVDSGPGDKPPGLFFKQSVTGGDPAGVVFSAPLNGGSSDEWVTGLAELGDRFQGSSFLELDRLKVLPCLRRGGYAQAGTGLL